MRRLFVLTMLGALACDSGVSGVADSKRLTPGFVAVDAKSTAAPAGATNPPTIRVSRGGIEVLGLISAPDLCQEVRGAIDRQAQVLTVTITAKAQLVVCAQAVGTYAYRVAGDVPSGTYTVKIVHAYELSGWPTKIALQSTVAIP